jgi:hypothetical protein
MSERCDPEFFQVLVCQIRKDAKVDVILSDALSVLPETDLSSQVRALLHRGSARSMGLNRPHQQVYLSRSATISDLVIGRRGLRLSPIRPNVLQNSANGCPTDRNGQ